jgi:hypothetical protein
MVRYARGAGGLPVAYGQSSALVNTQRLLPNINSWRTYIPNSNSSWVGQARKGWNWAKQKKTSAENRIIKAAASILAAGSAYKTAPRLFKAGRKIGRGFMRLAKPWLYKKFGKRLYRKGFKLFKT